MHTLEYTRALNFSFLSPSRVSNPVEDPTQQSKMARSESGVFFSRDARVERDAYPRLVDFRPDLGRMDALQVAESTDSTRGHRRNSQERREGKRSKRRRSSRLRSPPEIVVTVWLGVGKIGRSRGRV